MNLDERDEFGAVGVAADGDPDDLDAPLKLSQAARLLEIADPAEMLNLIVTGMLASARAEDGSYRVTRRQVQELQERVRQAREAALVKAQADLAQARIKELAELRRTQEERARQETAARARKAEEQEQALEKARREAERQRTREAHWAKMAQEAQEREALAARAAERDRNRGAREQGKRLLDRVLRGQRRAQLFARLDRMDADGTLGIADLALLLDCSEASVSTLLHRGALEVLYGQDARFGLVPSGKTRSQYFRVRKDDFLDFLRRQDEVRVASAQREDAIERHQRLHNLVAHAASRLVAEHLSERTMCYIEAELLPTLLEQGAPLRDAPRWVRGWQEPERPAELRALDDPLRAAEFLRSVAGTMV